MLIVRHHWRDRWSDRLCREFKCTIRRDVDHSSDYVKYTLYCKLFPDGLLRNNVQVFRTSASIDTSKLELPHSALVIQEKTSELRRVVLRVLESGYVLDRSGNILPILDNWRIEEA